MLTCGKEANVDGAVFVVEAFDFCLGGPLDGQGEATGAGTLGRDDKVGGVTADGVRESAAVGVDLAVSQGAGVELVGAALDVVAVLLDVQHVGPLLLRLAKKQKVLVLVTKEYRFYYLRCSFTTKSLA